MLLPEEAVPPNRDCHRAKTGRPHPQSRRRGATTEDAAQLRHRGRAVEGCLTGRGFTPKLLKQCCAPDSPSGARDRNGFGQEFIGCEAGLDPLLQVLGPLVWRHSRPRNLGLRVSPRIHAASDHSIQRRSPRQAFLRQAVSPEFQVLRDKRQQGAASWKD